MDKVCIIGLGKLGSHLYYALNKTAKYRVNYVVKSSKTKILPERINQCSIIFICTPDSNIEKITGELKKKYYLLHGKYVYHTSGAFDSELLAPLEKKGAYTGTFHPVQTFEERLLSHTKKFPGIYIALEGNPKAVKKAIEIVRVLKANTLIVSKENKLLHHINSVIASNYLVGYIYQLEKISQSISNIYIGKKGRLNGFKKSTFFNIYKPLIEQTLKNIEEKGLAKSLTGPIARNDLKTVQAHLNELNKKNSSMLPFYILMGTEAIEIALKNKILKKADAKILLGELNKFKKEKKKRN